MPGAEGVSIPPRPAVLHPILSIGSTCRISEPVAQGTRPAGRGGQREAVRSATSASPSLGLPEVVSLSPQPKQVVETNLPACRKHVPTCDFSLLTFPEKSSSVRYVIYLIVLIKLLIPHSPALYLGTSANFILPVPRSPGVWAGGGEQREHLGLRVWVMRATAAPPHPWSHTRTPRGTFRTLTGPGREAVAQQGRPVTQTVSEQHRLRRQMSVWCPPRTPTRPRGSSVPGPTHPSGRAPPASTGPHAGALGGETCVRLPAAMGC